ncbi:MAG: hypothetical protein PVI79_18840 [Gammaproteobacteria bacterium]|jgi:hypothetical protein
MNVIWVLVGSAVLVLVFMILWLRERRRANIEYIAYGLRADEDNTENTKTNITQMEASFVEAMSKLEELGEVKQDNWGQWVWTRSGKPVGQKDE